MIADIVDEALRVYGAAEEQQVPVRLMGGIAVQLHSATALPESLVRTPKDIDIAVPRKSGQAAGELLERLGYEPNKRFNMMNRGRRALFYDMENERQLDVFVGGFEMCHTIPITDRIDVEPITLPLAELMLTKLQIVELNEKDQRDILALLFEHDVGESDAGTINAKYIAKLCADEWGLWRTAKLNVERIREALKVHDLEPADRDRIATRLESLWRRVDDEPKGARFKLRDRIGDRKRWYEEPDEVG
jgi:Uncharacterised nucleotidyltransferase